MSESANRFSVCVFCGAKPGLDPIYAELARAAGRAIAERGWQMVYGGGRVGLMGVAADAALAAGGEVIGVIPEGMLVREQGHRSLTRLEVVPDMAVRKTRMIALSDAFLTLPGGLGTLDELFEVLTLRQVRFIDKPIALLNANGYFDRLLAMCEGFVQAIVARAFAAMAAQRACESAGIPGQSTAGGS
ncbi:MAG: TIGR00730 family Rossman fold protein [Betaproteobacteria bacterium]